MSREKVFVICNVFEIHLSWSQYPEKKIKITLKQIILTVNSRQDNYGKRIFFCVFVWKNWKNISLSQIEKKIQVELVFCYCSDKKLF